MVSYDRYEILEVRNRKVKSMGDEADVYEERELMEEANREGIEREKQTDLRSEIEKFNYEYGWWNGKLKMDEKPLTKKEEAILKKMTEIAFREMGERTRMGSGDDQAYVDGLYEQLKKDNNSKILVEIVFKLCKQRFLTDQKALSKSAQLPESYFLFKPNVKQHKVCYNAKSKNCMKCQEECDYSGKIFK
jgi:hypothetical protein